MGCGKSYTARNLSSKINVPFVDSDNFIADKIGISIKEIFGTKGEEFFRNEEKDFIINLDKKQDLIIATGGGMPCFENNIELMNQKGITIFLNRDKNENLKRLLKGKEKRPLIANLSDAEISDFYDKKFKERKGYYENALLHVNNADYNEIAIYIKALGL